MDLQVGVIISIVFLVSFLSYLFISKFLPHGKTFDEMIAEKKKIREEMLGALKTVNNKYGGSNSGNKRKTKKDVKKKDSSPKIQPTKTPPSDSEGENENLEDEQIVKEPTAVVQKSSLQQINKRKIKKQKNSESEEVEEVSKEKESLQAVIEAPIVPQNAGKNKSQPNQPSKKKGGKGGILVNKNEPALIKDNVVEGTANHFEEIHPKDAIEIQRTSAHVEEKNTKNFREHKKTKKETPPVSPKNQSVKEMSVTKKRNAESYVSSSTIDGPNPDEAGTSLLIRDLSRAELSKNQIQVLIDFLLNKQSDTIVKDEEEWTEGKSDLIQKLKKQLQEKEAQLKNEQDALSSMQMKLKDLRAEFNNEKIQNNATLKAFNEQMHNLKGEVKTLQSEIQFLNEKHNNEKQSMSVSFKQLQQKYLQASENLKTFEGIPNIQQIQDDNKTLQNEISSKNQQIAELNKFADESRKNEESNKQKLAESDSKIGELEIRLRKKDESLSQTESEMRQRAQDLASRDGEIQKLNNEVSHVKEILQRQTIEKEQLSQQLHQNNRAEENKIEIKNLQNALDSSKNELESQRALVNDYKMKIEDLSKQVTEAKHVSHKSGDNFLLNEKLNEMVVNHQNIVSGKDEQLAGYQKEIETLQGAKKDLSKQVEEQKAKNKTLESSMDAEVIKDLLIQHFPQHSAAVPASDNVANWMNSVLERIVSNNQSNHSTSTTPIHANHHSNSSSNNNIHDINTTSTKALNGDTNSTSGDNEIILLQNAQLRNSLEEYKKIISETESMLKNLELKVRDQDAYWTKVVLMKDSEIEHLKNHTEQS